MFGSFSVTSWSKVNFTVNFDIFFRNGSFSRQNFVNSWPYTKSLNSPGHGMIIVVYITWSKFKVTLAIDDFSNTKIKVTDL